MTPATEAPARSYTEKVLDVLCLFNACRGGVPVTVETLNGIGRDQFGLIPPFRTLPRPILAALNPHDNRAIRVGAVTTDAGVSLDLSFLFTLFKPTELFDASTNWRHVIEPEAQDKVRDKLSTFLAPAMLVDAGPEVWCAWPLASPIPADARALSILSRLAEALGADAEAARDLTLTLPLAGTIRNFALLPPEHVEIVEVDPARRYALEEIEAALVSRPSSEPTETTRRKGVRA